MFSFGVIATETCDIKRVGAIVNGWEQSPAVVYSGLVCLVPYSVDPRLRFYLDVKPSVKLLQTVLSGELTILENDVLVIASGVEYPIISIESWYSRPQDVTYHVITMEDLT